MKIENDADVGRLFTMFKDKDYDPKVLAKGGVIECGPKNNEQEGKPRMSLLPLDLLTELLVPAYEVGCIKYHRESWRKGFPVSVMMDACLRHLSKFYYDRENFDQDALRDQNIEVHHIGSAIFCLVSMYNSIHNHVGLDDRPELLSEEEREYRRKLSDFSGMEKIITAVTGEVNENK